MTKPLYFDKVVSMNWKREENNRLVQAILMLDNPKETRCFLRDLMTEKEIVEFANRLRVAEMLSNNIPYSTIEQKTGLSSTTVARVSRWLNGKQGGYRLIIKKLHHKNLTQSVRGVS